MKIDYERLKEISLKKENKNKKILDESETASFLIELWSKLLYKMNVFTVSELAQFINSIYHWLNSRKNNKTPGYKSGVIVEVEFGLKYNNETAYRHIGLVIEDFDSTVAVIPCTSTSSQIEIAEKGIWHHVLVGREHGFDRDKCVLLLNEMQVISKSRIITSYRNILDYEQGKTLFKYIKDVMSKKYFPKQIQELETEIKKLKERININTELSNDKIIILCQCVNRQEGIIKELSEQNELLQTKNEQKTKRINWLYWKLNQKSKKQY